MLLERTVIKLEICNCLVIASTEKTMLLITPRINSTVKKGN